MKQNFTNNYYIMYELFIELQDAIFWAGYIEELARENPEKFIFEFNDFLEDYRN